MKIILLQDIAKIGKRYDIKDVSDGYALNMLIPNGKAIPATPQAINKIDALKKKKEGEDKINQNLIEKNLSMISDATIETSVKANEKGHLFAGLHNEEILALIKKELRVDIPIEFIKLSKPIKEIGNHRIEIEHQNRSVYLNLILKSI